MAKRYSGNLQINVVYDDKGHYRTTVSSGGKNLWSGIVNPAPAGFGPGIGYDSSQAYDEVASSALAFADHEIGGIGDEAEFDEDLTGYLIRRSPRGSKKPSSAHSTRKGTVWGTKVTKKKIEQLARALFPRYGIKDVGSLLATIVKYRNNDGHVKIWRPEGGWSWFASPGTTVATPSLVALKFPADYRRTAEQARDDLYRQLEDAAFSVMSEDEVEAAVARGATATHSTRKSPARLDREIAQVLGSKRQR